MSETDTLLAYLSPWFTSQTENIAVEALGYRGAEYPEVLDDVVLTLRTIAEVIENRP